MKKKAMIVLERSMLWAIILIIVFLSFYALNGLNQGITPVGEIIRDPSSWVGKTVTVEGILESVPMPNPTMYGLCPQNQTDFLGIQWNSSDSFIPQYNATTAIVHGTIEEEEWTPPNLVPSHSMEFYYIEAENVELL